MHNQEDIDAAREISRKIKPSPKWEPMRPAKGYGQPGVLIYENSIYECSLRRYSDGWLLGGGKWALIGISSLDGEPRHDWREFQNIKNDLVGMDWEAVELYPREERLIDPSNYYMLWCAPKIPIGKNVGRQLCTPENCIAPQRGWEQ